MPNRIIRWQAGMWNRGAVSVEDIRSLFDWLYVVSDTPYAVDSPMWNDNLSTQIVYPGGDVADRTLYAIENVGTASQANDTLRVVTRVVGQGLELEDLAPSLLNNHPGLLPAAFLGYSSGTNASQAIMSTVSQAFDVLVVWKQFDAVGIQLFFDQFQSGVDTNRCFAHVNSSEQITMYGGSAQALTGLPVLVQGRWYAVLMHFDGASSTCRLWDSAGNDDTDTVASTVGTNMLDAITWNAVRTGGSTVQGQQYMIGIAETPVDADGEATISTFLSGYYGLG